MTRAPHQVSVHMTRAYQGAPHASIPPYDTLVRGSGGKLSYCQQVTPGRVSTDMVSTAYQSTDMVSTAYQSTDMVSTPYQSTAYRSTGDKYYISTS